jgi:hypothetical protein
MNPYHIFTQIHTYTRLLHSQVFLDNFLEESKEETLIKNIIKHHTKILSCNELIACTLISIKRRRNEKQEKMEEGKKKRQLDVNVQ